VLELLTEGHTNKSIGEQLYLSESTVKYYGSTPAISGGAAGGDRLSSDVNKEEQWR